MPVEQTPCINCGDSYLRKNKRQKLCRKCQATALRERKRSYAANYRKKFPEKVRFAIRRAMRKRRNYYRLKLRENNRKYSKSVKHSVFDHYSHGTFACACCGESNLDFLTLDHVNGGGTKERIAIFGRPNSAGTRFFKWLINSGFPSGYQILCANCNMSKGAHAACVHQGLRFTLRGGSCYL